MPVRPVHIHPDDEFLRVRSSEVEHGEDISDVVKDLWDTYNHHLPHIGGLAANQIGHLKRIMIVTDNYSNPYLCINPSYVVDEERSQRIMAAEGCFSLPDNLYMVERPSHIRVDYRDSLGIRILDTPRNMWSARCFLHELDHLDGILISDHAKSHFRKEGVGRGNPLEKEKV